MKQVVLLFILGLSCPIYSYSQVTSEPALELVESIPIETTLDNPDIRNTFEVWLEMIGRAQKTIDIEQFYISDEPGKKLQDILTAIYLAAQRNVKIRIIVDANMYRTYPESADSLDRHINIEVRKLNFRKITDGIQHAKYFIIDEKELFVGSQNFDWRALEHIHELGLRINDTSISYAYRAIFNFDWNLANDSITDFKKAQFFAKQYSNSFFTIEKDSIIIFPTYSPIGYIPDSTHWDETVIISLIDSAKLTLNLQFLQFSPFERRGETYFVIHDAILRAAKRGVKIRLIVSDWANGSTAVHALLKMSDLQNLEIAFTEIPEWSGGYIPYARVEHCKFIVADEKAFWIGTANCEKNYYYSSRNLGIAGTSSHIGKQLSHIFQKSWNSPYRQSITPLGKYKARKYGERK